MKAFWALTTGVLLGLAVGLWLGVNIGKEQPLLSNPFVERTLMDRAVEKGGEIYEDTKRAVKEGLE